MSFDHLYKIKGPICGIDIGFNSIKIIQLEKKGKHSHLLGFNYYRIPAGILTSTSEKDHQALSEAISKALDSAKPKKIKTQTIISGLPESKVFTKIIQVPSLNEKEQELAIPQESSRHVPLPLEQIYLDWNSLHLTEGSQEDVLIVAAPKILVNTYIKIFSDAGLELLALETKSLASGRALFTEEDKDANVIVDIGAEATGISIFDQNTIKFAYTIPHGGNTLTKAIASHLNTSVEEAEKIKRKRGLKELAQEYQGQNSLNQIMQDIIEEIGNAIKFYEKRSKPIRKIKQIVLCGGGAYTPGLTDYLHAKVGISTRLGNPLINFDQGSIKKFPQNEVLKFTTAIGLSLRESL